MTHEQVRPLVGGRLRGGAGASGGDGERAESGHDLPPSEGRLGAGMPDAPNVRFDIASFGELLSDPSRVAMLLSLMHGLTRPATELAEIAGVSQATASAHLKKLLGGSLVRVEQQGRRRYVAPEWLAGKPCLDWTERQNHLGGPLGSLLTQGMLQQEWLVRHRGGRAVRLTTRGRHKLAGLGVELPEG